MAVKISLNLGLISIEINPTEIICNIYKWFKTKVNKCNKGIEITSLKYYNRNFVPKHGIFYKTEGLITNPQL